MIDYGWTAYDAYQAGQVLADPNASQSAKEMAAGSLAMTVAFEAAEPDDILPISLPLDDVARLAAKNGADDLSSFVRAVPVDQVGTSQPFKTFKGEDGLSVFEGVTPSQVLDELPGNRVPNTTVNIPAQGLPPGTKVVPTAADALSKTLSDAHRILIRPEGWSVDRFAKELKKLVGWE